MKMVGVELRLRFGRRMMSTTATNANQYPWLMLPPSFDRRRGGMVYNFYSPAEQKEVLINKYGPGPDPPEFPDDNAKVVGSSHGWLALMNDRNSDLFLSNPITRRHIKLPPIQSLPNPELNLLYSVSKLILSASPDSPSCRAMASFGPQSWLAFCRPGHSRDWAPIGNLFMDRDDCASEEYPKSYADFVFSSKRNVFTCLTKSDVHKWGVEDWDLTNLDSPKMVWIRTNKDEEEQDYNLNINEHLVYADQTDDLFIVTHTSSGRPQEETFRLCTQRVKREEGGSVEMCKCKCPHTMFVGTNHAFAISPASPHFSPNSIYFADGNYNWRKGDVGIYHCATETVSNFYYPTTTTANNGIKAATLIWFTPSLT